MGDSWQLTSGRLPAIGSGGPRFYGTQEGLDDHIKIEIQRTQTISVSLRVPHLMNHGVGPRAGYLLICFSFNCLVHTGQRSEGMGQNGRREEEVNLRSPQI